MRTTLTKLMACIVILSMLVPMFGAAPVMAKDEGPGRPTRASLDVNDLAPAVAEPVSVTNDYIVLLADPPVASYRGGITGLSATNPQVTGKAKLDLQSPATQAYLTYLERQQAQFLTAATKMLGRAAEPFYTYKYALNGMALTMSPAEAAKVAEISGVVQVLPDQAFELDTDAGPPWIGAPHIWDGTATGTETEGEGMIVGILDTGINFDHDSFADPGPIDGYDHQWSELGKDYLGVCATEVPTYTCNDKLIGAYTFVRDDGESYSPEDGAGHGSHTSSTAAGNVVTASIFPAYTYTTVLTEAVVSGVAPHAHIIMYDVCLDPGQGSCSTLDSAAAVDQAILDGVDVINFSIGGGNDPYADTVSLAFLGAADAGIVVSKSAGNSGPETVAGRSPWVMTVGASTHNRVYTFESALTTFTGGVTVPVSLPGRSVTGAYGPAPVVYAGDVGDPLCGTPFTAGTWTNGEIVICDRGSHALVDKASNVKAGGAGGVIIANTPADGRTTLFDIAYALPGIQINITETLELMDWLSAGTNHMAAIAASTPSKDMSASNGDMMGDFSSRGPNDTFDVLKPDVTAPGVAILAAVATTMAGSPSEFEFYQGTSMAAPHNAGAALLMKSLHPTWTPMQIKSALMMTAKDEGIVDYDGSTVTPIDYGAGRIQVDVAAQAGFVLDETKANFEAAEPASGGDPKTLNLASMQNTGCFDSCSWTREISSTLDTAAMWYASTDDPAFTVDPATFTLPAGGTQVVTITADVSSKTVGEWVFATAMFTTTETGVPDAHMPIAVVPTKGVFPDAAIVNTRRDAGSKLVENIETEAMTLTAMTYGAQATIAEGWVMEDSTNDDFYDDLSQVYYTTMTVPGSTPYVAVEILETASPDLDIVLGYDLNGDGMPASNEWVAMSATGATLETIFLTGEDLMGVVGNTLYGLGGTYWVLVQNWDSSGAGASDYFKLATAAADGAATSSDVWVTTPATATVGMPFDARLYYDFGMSWDAWYGLLSFYDGAEWLSDVPAHLYRHPDDVTKGVTAVMTDSTTVTVTYAITIAPNVTGMDLTYMITDTIPAGGTLITDSVTGGAMGVGNQVLWSGTMVGTYDWAVSDNLTDLECALAGGYLDLESIGILPQAGITGTTGLWSAFSGHQFSFYGQDYGGVGFSPDALTVFDWQNNFGTDSDTPQTLPDPALPNNILAGFWKDLEIVYSAALTQGVSLASGGTSVAIIEYDDVRPAGGDGSEHYDIQFWLWAGLGPGPEYTIEFDNIVGPVSDAVVGVENAAGTDAATYATPAVITDGLTICFDWAGPTDPHVITYDVTFGNPDEAQILINTVDHTVVDPGADVVMLEHRFLYGFDTTIYMPVIMRNMGP